MLLVPYNSMSAMPHWAINRDGVVVPNKPRQNTYKCGRSVGNWDVEQHHVFFVPAANSPPMASGAKYSMAIITVQCGQNSSFFIWNTLPVIIFLPILTATA